MLKCIVNVQLLAISKLIRVSPQKHKLHIERVLPVRVLFQTVPKTNACVKKSDGTYDWLHLGAVPWEKASARRP